MFDLFLITLIQYMYQNTDLFFTFLIFCVLDINSQAVENINQLDHLIHFDFNPEVDHTV